MLAARPGHGEDWLRQQALFSKGDDAMSQVNSFDSKDTLKV
ncbi:MAG: hypothetical protein JWN36_1120, partial [Microbacteriaceae bacterium]|nr:hypothetical protein [Microbacteriaceae bacterium]